MEIHGFIKAKKKTIEIKGADRFDFLQRLTSQDFRNPKTFEVVCGSFLEANALVIGFFEALILENSVYLLVDSEAAEKVFSQITKFHFAEKLEYLMSSDFEVYEVWPGKEVFSETEIRPEHWTGVVLSGHQLKLFENSTGGFSLVIPSTAAASLHEFLETHQIPPLTEAQYETLRICSGQPKWGQDFTSKNLILEGPFQKYFSRNKGCYPGQEIVERVFTYGKVAKKLVGLKWENGSGPKVGDEISLSGETLGKITSVALDQGRGMGWVSKKGYLKGTELESRPSAVKLQVYELPGTISDDALQDKNN